MKPFKRAEVNFTGCRALPSRPVAANTQSHVIPQFREAPPGPTPGDLPRRLRRFALTVMPILAGLHTYIGWRLLPALPIGTLGTVVGVIMLGMSTLLIPLGMLARFFVPRPTLADRIVWIGSLVMGLFSSLLVLTLLRDLLLLAAGTPSFAGTTAIMVILAAVAVTAIGFINARRVAQVVRIDVPLAGLSASLAGFTIVQISDIHVGPTIKDDYVSAIVDRVNGLDADLIAITGDVVDGSVALLSIHTAPLARLRARHGAYVVTGNHEYYSGALEWMAEFRLLGLRGLMNEHVVIEHDGARLVVAGVTDFSAGLFDLAQRSDPLVALAGSPEDVPRILLAHQPRTAPAAASAGFDLQLSGHTHGGQFWPWNLLVGLQQPFTAGLHRLGRLWVYTSRGTGYWGPPKRFGAPSEITLLRLVPDPVSRG
jgi:predicted MPP superfamily phosphohydrolase